uniref:Ubiquitin-like domain-containing protein n=1 Tax=Timema shepardi TaxID=629360 RepID=A0A7R9B3A7_TIMSH|nr:unnamed protein product [Timema shepardi]
MELEICAILTHKCTSTWFHSYVLDSFCSRRSTTLRLAFATEWILNINTEHSRRIYGAESKFWRVGLPSDNSRRASVCESSCRVDMFPHYSPSILGEHHCNPTVERRNACGYKMKFEYVATDLQIMKYDDNRRCLMSTILHIVANAVDKDNMYSNSAILLESGHSIENALQVDRDLRVIRGTFINYREYLSPWTLTFSVDIKNRKTSKTTSSTTNLVRPPLILRGRRWPVLYPWYQARFEHLAGLNTRMKIVLKNGDGESTTIEVNPQDTFCDLKTRIKNEAGIELDLEQLKVNGRKITDDQFVSEYFFNGYCECNKLLYLTAQVALYLSSALAPAALTPPYCLDRSIHVF